VSGWVKSEVREIGIGSESDRIRVIKVKRTGRWMAAEERVSTSRVEALKMPRGKEWNQGDQSKNHMCRGGGVGMRDKVRSNRIKAIRVIFEGSWVTSGSGVDRGESDRTRMEG
jgi:hypothetical protein